MPKRQSKTKTTVYNWLKNPPAQFTDNHLKRILKHLDQTVKCGLHSGFKPCCIRYYIFRLMFLQGEQRWEYFENHANLMDECNPGYIPCPECFSKKNFIKVKNCPKGQNCNHYDEC